MSAAWANGTTGIGTPNMMSGSSEGVDSSSENEIQKLNIGTCLLTGIIDIPLKVNIRPRISKHGGETVDITLPYEVEQSENNDKENENVSFGGSFDENEEETKEREEISKKEESFNKNKSEHNEFIQFIAPELEIEDAKIMLDSKNIEVQLVPATILKFKDFNGDESNLLFDKVNLDIIKTIFPFEGSSVSKNLISLSEAEKKIMKMIL